MLELYIKNALLQTLQTNHTFFLTFLTMQDTDLGANLTFQHIFTYNVSHVAPSQKPVISPKNL